jgi:hypothetical protein
MSVVDELLAKLSGADERVTQVLEEVEELIELKRSLDGANQSLVSTSNKLGELASSMSRSAGGLAEVTKTLRETIDVIRQTDPAAIVAAQKALKDTVVDGFEGARKNHVAAEASLSTRLQEGFRSISTATKTSATRETAIIALLIVNLAVLLFAAATLGAF